MDGQVNSPVRIKPNHPRDTAAHNIVHIVEPMGPRLKQQARYHWCDWKVWELLITHRQPMDASKNKCWHGVRGQTWIGKSLNCLHEVDPAETAYFGNKRQLMLLCNETSSTLVSRQPQCWAKACNPEHFAQYAGKRTILHHSALWHSCSNQH